MSNKTLKKLSPTTKSPSIAQKIKQQIGVARAQRVISFDELKAIRESVEEAEQRIQSPGEISKEGADPVFTLYASVQRAMAMLCNILLQMPALKPLAKKILKAENEYFPSFPPMSPITGAYFAMWTLCDLRAPGTSETQADIFVELADVFGISPLMRDCAKLFADSRMGIYQHCGFSGNKIVLRELVTNREILFSGSSGYDGNQGQLWLVRAVAPLNEVIPYWVGMGTPYVLLTPDISEWISFFARHGICKDEVGHEARLHQFLKFGPEPRYWSEFIFEGYVNFDLGAVFLRGLPDVPQSRPHSGSFDPLLNFAKSIGI